MSTTAGEMGDPPLPHRHLADSPVALAALILGIVWTGLGMFILSNRVGSFRPVDIGHPATS